MKKETAVEWFYENLKNLIKESELTDMKPSEFDSKEKQLIEQAKEMFKEQIINAHSDWIRITDNLPTRTANQYYNETFKSE
jgi:hypothetical protein